MPGNHYGEHNNIIPKESWVLWKQGLIKAVYHLSLNKSICVLAHFSHEYRKQGLWAGMKGGLFAKKSPPRLVWPNESKIKRLVNIQPHLLNTVLIVSKQQYYTEYL